MLSYLYSLDGNTEAVLHSWECREVNTFLVNVRSRWVPELHSQPWPHSDWHRKTWQPLASWELKPVASQFSCPALMCLIVRTQKQDFTFSQASSYWASVLVKFHPGTLASSLSPDLSGACSLCLLLWKWPPFFCWTCPSQRRLFNQFCIGEDPDRNWVRNCAGSSGDLPSPFPVD